MLYRPPAPGGGRARVHTVGLDDCVAVEREPLVHCVESIDLPEGVGADDVLLDPRGAPYERPGQVRARGVLRPGDPPVSWSLPYGATEGAVPSRSVELTLSPYHEWARRDPPPCGCGYRF